MKKIILIPLLLSTILLVGCETETELDRCIEANGGNAEFDIAQYEEKAKTLVMPEDTPYEDYIEASKEQRRIFKSSMTDSELEFYNCGVKKFSERNKELKDSGMDDALERLENIDDDEIINLCLPKNRAKQICNSQGIY